MPHRKVFIHIVCRVNVFTRKLPEIKILLVYVYYKNGVANKNFGRK